MFKIATYKFIRAVHFGGQQVGRCQVDGRPDHSNAEEVEGAVPRFDEGAHDVRAAVQHGPGGLADVADRH